MTNAINPWLPAHLDAAASAPTPQVARSGPLRPQAGVPSPDAVDQLPVRRTDRAVGLWLVGAHGGAAESTLAELDERWSAAEHSWPLVQGSAARVVIVARTSARGLFAAKAAAKQWGSGLVPSVELLGLVLVADAPGRLPKPLRDLMKVVSGGYPRAWRVPWIESWRFVGHPQSDDAIPRELGGLINDLHTLLRNGVPSGAVNRKDQNDGAA